MIEYLPLVARDQYRKSFLPNEISLRIDHFWVMNFGPSMRLATWLETVLPASRTECGDHGVSF